MKKMIAQIRIFLIFGLAAGLAGCQSFSWPGQRAATAPQPAVAQRSAGAALEGRWLPTDEAAKGVYVARFDKGTFVSVSPDTGKPLAKGKYIYNSDENIKLDYVGAASGTAVTAQCQLRTPSAMYCVPTVGGPFNLQRQA